jgi:hypothetical protein
LPAPVTTLLTIIFLDSIPVPRVEEEIIGRGSNRITIAEEQLTSYFKVKVIGKSLIDIEQISL